MKARTLLTMAAALAVTNTITLAGPLPPPPPLPMPIYDNIGGTGDGLNLYTEVLDGEFAYDDLQVVGGGPLAGFSLAYGTEAFQGFAEGNDEVEFYLDDGATSPGALDTNEDTLLLSESLQGLVASAGPFGSIIYERADVFYPIPTVTIPDNATIWAGVRFTSTAGGLLRTLHFAPISVGSSDQFTYQENGPPLDTINFGLPADAGLGWELYVVPEPASLSFLAACGLVLLRRRR